MKSIAQYSLLGRSGLRVSPLCLGTMTFGTEWGWGSDENTARSVFERYLEAGGNFIDTADGYTNGRSEELVGQFTQEAKNRDRLVIATKFTFNTVPGDPNAGGNGRKNIHRALEGSLRRLKTDYVDLYWLHAWDGLTPVDEVMETLHGLVQQGKIRYIGLSDTPAWYFARAQTMAELRGWSRVVALQLEYSLVERNIEREHIPAALELGAGVLPWSPLASGFLSGKYTRSGSSGTGEGRLETTKNGPNPVFQKFNDHNWKVLDVLNEVARELSAPPARVALAWVAQRPGVTSTIIGATKLAQLDENMAALELQIPPALSAKLEQASRPALTFPYNFFEPNMQGMLTGGTSVRAEPTWFRPR